MYCRLLYHFVRAVVQRKKEEATSGIKTETQTVKKAEKEDINSVHLRDKDTLYADDDETSVVTMYLTVSRGNASENTDHSWSEINSYSVEDYENMGSESLSGGRTFTSRG